jgi:hypothetical protein
MQASNKPLIIGIAGVARSGKDTFASILTNRLNAVGKSVDKFAFADALKQDCDAFCKEKLGVSAFTQVPNEKLLIRPLLVWYGDAKRKQSNGRYWVDIIDAKVKASKADFCLVTDVRYDFYERDEISWVKQECHGLVVHVSRWSMNPTNVNLMGTFDKIGAVEMYQKVFVPPANDHEKENDPKVKAKADHIVEWQNVDGLTMEQLTTAPSLVAHVDSFIDLYLDL